jgi:hypothetical protein
VPLSFDMVLFDSFNIDSAYHKTEEIISSSRIRMVFMENGDIHPGS